MFQMLFAAACKGPKGLVFGSPALADFMRDQARMNVVSSTNYIEYNTMNVLRSTKDTNSNSSSTSSTNYIESMGSS